MSFRPALSFFDVTNITVGAIVGADIYIAAAITAGMVGPASLLAWALAGILATTLALTLAECARLVPEVGGPYAYVHRAFGPFAGFAAGAEAVAVCAPGATVVMRATAGEPALDVIVAGMAESALDIVLVEGYKHAPMPRIEVLADGAAPTSDSRWLVALACDDAGASASGVPTFPRGDVIGIAQLICALLSEHRGDGVRALERDALPAAEAQRQA
jgi:amino acid transporter